MLSVEQPSHGRAHAAPSVGMLFDAYQVAVFGKDTIAPFPSDAAIVGHMQDADVPGRAAAGTGRDGLNRLLERSSAWGNSGGRRA